MATPPRKKSGQNAARCARAVSVPSDVTNVDNQIKAMVGELEKSKEHGVLSGMSGGHHLGASDYFGPFRTVSDVTKHLADATQVAPEIYFVTGVLT